MIRRLALAVVLVAASSLTAPVAFAGNAKTSQCPAMDSASTGVKVALSDLPVTVSMADTRTGATADVAVSFSGGGTTFSLSSPGGAAYGLLDASWCVKSATSTTDPLFGAGLSGGTPSTNKKGSAQRIGYVTLYSVLSNASCYRSDQGYVDLAVAGALGTFDNAQYFTGADGTCQTPLVEPITWSVVHATTFAEARVACAALSTPSLAQAVPLRAFGYTEVGADWWGCYVSS